METLSLYEITNKYNLNKVNLRVMRETNIWPSFQLYLYRQDQSINSFFFLTHLY